VTRLAILALAAACGAPAQLAEPLPISTDHCIRIAVDHGGAVHYTRACADSAELCDFVRGRAIALAEVAGVVMVGACRTEVSR
jgi:hypothetical protein